MYMRGQNGNELMRSQGLLSTQFVILLTDRVTRDIEANNNENRPETMKENTT
jgi:hypothetical protein